MSTDVRPQPWALVLVVLALVLAYDLGANSPAPLLGTVGTHVSFQVDVVDPEGDGFAIPGLDPVPSTFILKDLLVANTQGNDKKVLNVKEEVYPTLRNGLIGSGVVKIAGKNLMDWAKGNNDSPHGGGRSGKKGNPIRSQAGLVGLTGGVVFGAGTSVVVFDYEGPLYLDGILVP